MLTNKEHNSASPIMARLNQMGRHELENFCDDHQIPFSNMDDDDSLRRWILISTLNGRINHAELM